MSAAGTGMRRKPINHTSLALILHIDTATAIGSVCLSRNGEVLETMENADQKDHAATITLFIQQLMKRHHIGPDALDAIAVSAGPGSYTGLRVGTATAKGLCYTWDKPLIGISTLQMMAAGMLQQLIREGTSTSDAYLVPMIDARRMEVFTAVYNTALEAVLLPQAMVLEPSSYGAVTGSKPAFFFGDGAAKWQASTVAVPDAFFPEYSISAAHMVPLAEKAFADKDFRDVAYFSPDYLKAFYFPRKS